ncbi:MAG: hypothetical protein K0Q46_6335 [Rhodococcus erythropolis]|jgi:hypothetical protein|nr:hypothetical protein [Rhodococcus erythropolis]
MFREYSRPIESVGFNMIVMFLQTTAALFTDLLGNVWSGSLMPGIDGVTGSLVSAIDLS